MLTDAGRGGARHLPAVRASRTQHHQVWFGPTERPLYGWVSVPEGQQVRGAVVLCPPMGEEGRATHRTFRTLAESLAEAGLLALRFDYDGTGDSAGRQDDPDRVQAWLRSVEEARRFVLGLGAPQVAVVGMRLGATIAACEAAAATSGDETTYSSMVLWDPCQSGRRFLREGEALHQFGEGDEAGGTPADGLRHTPGFQYDAATASAMRGLDLGKLPTDRPLAPRVLLLTRADRPAGPSAASLGRGGSVVEEGVALDQELLLDLAPSDCLVPRRTMAHVVSWLAAGAEAFDPAPVRLPETEQPTEVAGAGEGSVRVGERSVRFGPAGLYGIATEPIGGNPREATGAPWVVLVNVAAEHHIGPGRRWVEFARRWAALGYRTVRVDQSGIGDSPLHPGQEEGAPFSPEWIDDMREVVATLRADGPVVLIGLCSGAYSSLEAALWSDVDSVFAVNPRLTLYPAARDTRVYTSRRRAGIVPTRPIAWLAHRHRILAGGLWRIYRQVALWHAPYVVLRRVLRRGTRIELVACPDDAQHFTEVAVWWPALWLARRRGRLDFTSTDRLDHSLLGRGAQEFMWERATAFLADRHEALRADGSSR